MRSAVLAGLLLLSVAQARAEVRTGMGPGRQHAARTLYIDAVTAWNSASLDIAVEYVQLV